MDWIAGLHYHWQADDDIFDGDKDGDKNQSNLLQLPPTISSRAFYHNQNMSSPSRAAFLTAQRLISDRVQIVSKLSKDKESEDISSEITPTSSNPDSTNLDLQLVLPGSPSSLPPRGLDFSDVIAEKLSKF